MPCGPSPNVNAGTKRLLLQALYVVSNRLDLIVGQPGDRLFMRHLAGIVSFAKQQHDVVLAQFGRLQGRPQSCLQL